MAVVARPSPTPSEPTGTGANGHAGSGFEQYKRLSRVLPHEREHAANVVRFRIALTFGSPLWLGFCATDWLLTVTVYPQPYLPLLALRLGTLPLYLTFLWLLHRDPMPSPRTFVFLDVISFGSASMCIGALASAFGGIAGPYTPGVILVLITRSAFVVQPWRRAALPNAIIVTSHFVALYVADWFKLGTWSAAFAREPLVLVLLHTFSLTTGGVLLAIASNTTWMLGRRVFAARNLGNYRLEQQIGMGGHGEVWKAYHPGLRQQVAIKVLRGELAHDERALARFEREIDTLCRLRHPHTIRILDYGVTADGVCYYAMELLEGVTLADLVHERGPLEPARTVYLLLQAAGALAEAHEHGVVHRDLKPENLFVLHAQSVSDFIKLIDFGIAKLDISPADSVTRTGMVVGTPAFMAPEVASGQPAGFRADVYGLGAVGYFLLTGRPPRIASSGAGPSGQIARPAEVLGRAIPTDIEHVIMRCLYANPQARYEDAADLAASLAALHERYGYQPTEGGMSAAGASQSRATRTSPFE